MNFCSSPIHHPTKRVAEFDSATLSDELWTHHPTNFRKVVCGCMDSYDSEPSHILQHFSSSTRKTDFCTAYISKFSDFRTFFPFFPPFSLFFGIFFSKCCCKSTEIADFSVKISLIFVGISGNCRQLPEITIFCTNFSKFARKWCKSSSLFDEQIHQFIKIW